MVVEVIPKVGVVVFVSVGIAVVVVFQSVFVDQIVRFGLFIENNFQFLLLDVGSFKTTSIQAITSQTILF